MFICSRCQKEFELYDQLRRHTGKVHKVHASDLYIEVELSGIPPKCACGCGERPNWRNGVFQTYLTGHNSRVNNPINTLTPDEWVVRKARHSATNKAQFASGERKMWSEGKSILTDPTLQRAARKISENKERSRKISDALIGVPKSEEHKNHSKAAITKTWKNPELRQRQADNRVEYFTSGNCRAVSKLEDTFKEVILQDIKHTRQHYIREIKALYDFYLPDHNIIIEVHGDFWHCNPNTKHAIPKYESQVKNIKNDEKKRVWCELNNIPLLVFWESDIRNRPDWVSEQLNKALIR